MSSEIKRGESLFIPFKNGVSISDSQLRPRMYKTKEAFERYSYRFDNAEMVEYAEVLHGRWIELGSDDTDDFRWKCSNCNEVQFEYPGRNNYCPNCGAQMMDGDGNG